MKPPSSKGKRGPYKKAWKITPLNQEIERLKRVIWNMEQDEGFSNEFDRGRLSGLMRAKDLLQGRQITTNLYENTERNLESD